MTDLDTLLTQALALVSVDQCGELADLIEQILQANMRDERAVCVLELRAMAAALEKSAAADWPDGGRASRRRRGQQDAFDDGLLTATGRLRCRAAVLENEGVKP